MMALVGRILILIGMSGIIVVLIGKDNSPSTITIIILEYEDFTVNGIRIGDYIVRRRERLIPIAFSTNLKLLVEGKLITLQNADVTIGKQVNITTPATLRTAKSPIITYFKLLIISNVGWGHNE
ncbi:MAG: hypothetical protein IKX03_03550, partial [Bacteroidales bacterium]|nr:hypothetical protein [Bacteroidales bacterium]